VASLERAIAIAAEAHSGQVDKSGAPYILHPLRVMLGVTGVEEQIVGVLHDVIEDCPGWTFERLRTEGFSEEVLRGLDAVTNRSGESYDEFVLRAGSDAIARAVKMSDLRDNMDLSRISTPSERDFARIEKYRSALITLESKF
jgi:(p)ppGpp synthase/HD superfamily hydrolase